MTNRDIIGALNYIIEQLGEVRVSGADNCLRIVKIHDNAVIVKQELEPIFIELEQLKNESKGDDEV